MRPAVGLGVRSCVLAAFLALLSAFDWPEHTERVLRSLERANTPHERRDLLRLLGKTGDGKALPALLAATKDADPMLRAEALRALSALRRAEALAPALTGLTDLVASVRLAAVESLAELGGAEATAPLTRSLSDSEVAVRVATARALGRMQAAQAGPALAATLDDPSTEVRIAAALALGELGGARTTTEPGTDFRTILGPLSSKLRDPAPELRKAVVQAIARVPDERAGAALVQALDDPSEQVVVTALRGLFGRAPNSSDERLRALAGDPRPRVQSLAKTLLARRGAASPEPSREAKAGSTPAWLPALERTVDVSAGEAEALVEELERSIPAGEQRVADPLVEWLPRAPDALKPRIVALLGRSGATSATPALEAALKAPSHVLRAAALEALAQTGDARAASAVLPLLESPEPALQERAARALARLGRRDQIDALHRSAERSVERTRRAALVALAGVLERLEGPLPARTERKLVETLERALEGRDEASFASAARCLGLLKRERALEALRAAPQHSSTRRSAVIRASTPSRSALAKALRNSGPVTKPEATAISATSLAARALAGDQLDTNELVELVRHARWPLGPVASFALVRLVASGASEVVPRVCSLLDTAEPTTRANLVAALAYAPATDCLDAQGLDWLSSSRSSAVRRAAARWAHARARANVTPRFEGALARCAAEDPSTAVREACAGAPNTLVIPAESTPHDTVVALVLADASVLLSFPDASGDPTWPGLGNIAVENPWSAPYGRE